MVGARYRLLALARVGMVRRVRLPNVVENHLTATGRATLAEPPATTRDLVAVVLKAEPGLSLRELGGRLGKSKTTIAHHINVLKRSRRGN